MKDYYSILEINQSASAETIEKVHKLLVKKYHPDLQPNENKREAELKLRDINEAYEVLTDENKKREYDEKLKEEKIKEIMLEIKQNHQENQYDDNYTQDVVEYAQQGISDDEIRRQAQVYYDELYRQFLYRSGYIKDYKAIFKNYVAMFLTILIIIAIIYILFKVPYFKGEMLNLIENNEACATYTAFAVQKSSGTSSSK